MIDLHTHSLYSPDASDPVFAMCRTAGEQGLYAYAVTDHCEMNDPTGAFFETAQKSIDGVRSFAEEHSSYPTVFLAGAEIGQATQNREDAARFYETFYDKTDLYIGSMHNIKDMEDFYFLRYTQDGVDDLLKRYFAEVYEMVCLQKYDTLAHLTYPLRYMVGEQKMEVDLSRYSDAIDAILREQIARDGALEVNTSGLRQPIGETIPSLSVVKRFRELGGKYVTLGSDAHTAADLGKGIAEGMALVREAGFEAVTFFRNHRPVCVEL